MKVVDLSCDVAGRFAAKLLAHGGADVRRPGPWEAYLDLGKQQAAWCPELMTGADLAFASFDRGTLQGLAAEHWPHAPEDSVRVVTSTFGTTGPYAAWRGGGTAAWAAGGYLAITGEPGRAPLPGPEHLCEYVAGYSAAIAAEAGLARRRRTGQGCDLDVSAMETMLCLHQSTFARLSAGAVRTRTGRYAEVYPLAVFPCAEGHVCIGVSTNPEFDLLCVAAGCPELLGDERFASGFSRLAHADAIDEALVPFLQGHSADEVVGILQAGGVPATKVVDPREILESPQLAQRGFFVDAPGGGRMPGSPLPPARVFAEPQARTSTADDAWPLQPRPGDPLPLQRVRVLDFTAWWAGPSATRTLADLGADVVWIEKPNSRASWADLYNGPEAGSYQLYDWKMFRHKRSVVLDLGSEDGRAAARRLAGHADVLVENFRPGVADRLGIGPQALCAANPGLVYVSLSGFGGDGPLSRWRSYGPNIEAASSVLACTGYADGVPMRLGHALPDGVGGLAGALAALRGLREREARGCGGWYDVSQLEAYAATNGEQILAASRGHRTVRTGVDQSVFPCRGEDEWIALRLDGDKDRQRMADIIGAEPTEAQIAAFTVQQEKIELAQRLQGAGLQAFPALTPPELIADPHLAARGFFVPVAVQNGTFPMPSHPYRSPQRLADSDGVVPTLGEHQALVR